MSSAAVVAMGHVLRLGFAVGPRAVLQAFANGGQCLL
jgi:hypothetical protein